MASPSDINRRIDKLTIAWDGLRNDALGRGTVLPAGVSAALAKRIADEWTQFHEWRDELTPMNVLFAAPFAISGEIETWQTKYNEEAANLRAALGAGNGPSGLVVVDHTVDPLEVFPAIGNRLLGFAVAVGIVWVLATRR